MDKETIHCFLDQLVENQWQVQLTWVNGVRSRGTLSSSFGDTYVIDGGPFGWEYITQIDVSIHNHSANIYMAGREYDLDFLRKKVHTES